MGVYAAAAVALLRVGSEGSSGADKGLSSARWRQDGPLWQFARLSLSVAAPGRCGGPRGHLARRRRRGPEGLRAAGGACARDLPWKARLVIGGAAPRPD
jgi:hypothetical protein